MRLSRTISKFSYTIALLHGFLIGAVSIGLFALLIQWQDIRMVDTPEAIDPPELQPVIASPGEPNEFSFFAKQHGVFTTADGATQVLQSNPELKSAAVIIAEDKYYIWSAISVVEAEVKSEGSTESFVKPFRIEAQSCSEEPLKNIPVLLSETDKAKFYFEGVEPAVKIPSDWKTNILAISTLSKDVNVVRAQLLAHYIAQNECLKVSF
ncbi:MAG: hypothetical protein ACE3JQ_09105 [Paenisporosarcina sp.]